jgi:hypothetical protein
MLKLKVNWCGEVVRYAELTDWVEYEDCSESLGDEVLETGHVSDVEA